MKKFFALLLAAAMLLSLAACGKEPDPNAGIYEGVSGEKDGVVLTMEELYPGESYLELKDGGKAILVLEGEEYTGKWELDGEDLDLVVEGEDCPGTLQDGVITFEFADSDIFLTFAREDNKTSDEEDTDEEEVVEEEAAPAEPEITYEDAGYWEIVRIESQNEDDAVSAEDMESLKAYGITIYLELLEDGTGVANIDEQTAITWHDGAIFVEDAVEIPYTVTDGELALDMDDAIFVFVRAEKPIVMVSEMEQAGFTDYMETATAYPYLTKCYEDESYDTVGTAIVTNYDIVESAEGYAAKDGYEWRLVDIEVLFNDENAWNYGISATTRIEDYYNTQLFDNRLVELDESEDYYSYTSVVMHQGQEMEVYYRFVDYWGDWIGEECTYYAQWAVQVPIGYDGMVVGLQNARLETYEDTYLTDYDPAEFVLFRLYNAGSAPATDYDASDVVGSYSVYAMEQDGEYVDYEAIVALGMDMAFSMSLYEDGTGYISMDGEEDTITYTDTQLIDSSGYAADYYFADGMMELHLDETTILYCTKD